MINTAHSLLKARDIAAILGISKAGAYKLMQMDLPTVRFGRSVRVRLEDLENYISSNVIHPGSDNHSNQSD